MELDRLREQIDRVFKHTEEAREQMLAEGSRWEPVLDAVLGAAHGAWQQHGEREHRLELATLAEAPLPQEEP